MNNIDFQTRHNFMSLAEIKILIRQYNLHQPDFWHKIRLSQDKHELRQYKKNQKTELNAKIKELKANEKNSCNILLSKQKIKYLYSLQDSSYSADRKDKIQSLESELLLTK